MLKSLVIENVKGKSGTFEFGKVTRLLGRNEVGKTGIKDAICYAFAGADSAGVRNPRHLITNGEEALRVEVTSEKATIARTLTQKGSQSLSIIRNGVRTPCSQEQLSKALGASPDLFLACFLPGYFMTLPDARRQAVLNEILPPVDRAVLLREQLGFDLTEDDMITVGKLDRRPDLIASSVSTTRRAILAEHSQLKGQIESYTAMANTNPKEPALSAALDSAAYWEGLYSLWGNWTARHTAWKATRAEAEKARAWNTSLAEERSAAKAELRSIELVPVPEKISHSGRKAKLYLEVSPGPAKPAALNLPEGDRCPCCGQIVGSKHREKVRADTEAMLAQYEQDKAAVATANNKIREEIARLDSDEFTRDEAIRVATTTNKALQHKIDQLERRLASLVDRPIPELGPEPQQPTDPYDGDKHFSAKEEGARYQRALGQYEHAVKQTQEAGHKLGELKAQLAPLAVAIERFERIEAAVMQLPLKELALRAEQLTINGYTFSLEGTTVTRGDGMPYALLSTGAGMKADIMLCFKFNSLMGPKAPGIIFIDNADLVDVVPGDTPMQVFMAYVRPDLDKLTVEIE